MGKSVNQQKPQDVAMTVIGQGNADLSLIQDKLPDTLRLLPGESSDAYLERIAAPFMEWLLTETMVKGSGYAMGALTRLMEKKMDAQIKFEMLTGGRGKVKRSISGTPGAIRQAMGAQRLDEVMAGARRPSDFARNDV